MTDFELLCSLLAKHGFSIAATTIKPHDLRNIHETIRGWADYPANMADYPTHIRKPPPSD